MQITFTGDRLLDLVHEADLFVKSFNGAASADAPATTKKEKAKPSADKSGAAEKPSTQESASGGTATASSSGHDLKAVSDAVAALVSKVGRAKTIEFFKTFKVARAGELKPEQYPEFLKKAEELIAA